MDNNKTITKNQLMKLILSGKVNKYDVLSDTKYYDIYAKDCSFFENCFKDFLRKLAIAGMRAILKGHLNVAMMSYIDASKERAEHFLDDMLSEFIAASEQQKEDVSVFAVDNGHYIHDYDGEEIIRLNEDDITAMTIDDFLRMIIPVDMLKTNMPNDYKVNKTIFISGRMSCRTALRKIRYNEYGTVIEILKFIDLVLGSSVDMTYAQFLKAAYISLIKETSEQLLKSYIKDKQEPVTMPDIKDFDYEFNEDEDFSFYDELDEDPDINGRKDNQHGKNKSGTDL